MLDSPSLSLGLRLYKYRANITFFKYLGTDYYSTDTYEENNVFRFVSLFRNESLIGDRVVVSEYYNSCLLHARIILVRFVPLVIDHNPGYKS